MKPIEPSNITSLSERRREAELAAHEAELYTALAKNPLERVLASQAASMRDQEAVIRQLIEQVDEQRNRIAALEKNFFSLTSHIKQFFSK